MQQKTNSFLKKFTLFLCGLFCIIAVFITAFPWFVSTPTGKQMLLSSLSSHFTGSLKVDALSLAWRGPQEIVGLRFESLDGKVKLSCEKISCESPLLSILRPSRNIGLVQIQKPEVELRQTLIKTPIKNEPKVQVASLLAGAALNTYLPIFKVPFIGKLDIQDGKLSLFSENIAPITFNFTHGNLLANKNLSEASVNIAGETLQNGIKGSVLIDSSLKKTNSLNRSIESKVSLKHFPVDGVDQLLSLKLPRYRKLFTEAIGPSLDLECAFTFSKETCKASLEASSDKIQTQVQTQLKENELSLLSPATMQITLSPKILQKVYNKFPELAPFASEDPIQFLATFSKLAIPKTDIGLALKETSFSSNIEVKPYQASDMQLGCTGKLSSSKLNDEITTDLSITMTKESTSSNSKIHLSCKKPFLSSDQEILASIELGKTPVAFLENFFHYRVPLAKILGATVNGKIFLQGNEKKMDISSRISSSLLQVNHGHFLWNNKTLSLAEPLQASYLMTPVNFQYFTSQEEAVLQKEAQITASFSHLELQDFSNLESMKVNAAITSSPLNFSKLFSLKKHTIENLYLNLVADSISEVSLDLKSKQFSMQFIGGIEKKRDFLFWEKPIQIQYMLTNEELKSLYVRKHAPTLLQKAPIQIKIDPTRFALNPLSLNQVQLTGHLYGESLLFEDANQTQKVKVQNLQATAHFSGDKDLIDFSLSSDVAEGKFHCQGKMNRLRSPDFFLKAKLALQQFPLELVDTLAGVSLTPILGSLIDLKLSIDKRNETQSIFIHGSNPLLKLSGGITLNPQAVFLTDSKAPLQLEFLLTKQAYDLLAKEVHHSFALTEETLFKASVVQLNIPFVASNYKNPDLANLLLNIQVENDQVSFKNKETLNPLKLINTKLSLLKKNEKTPLYLSLDTTADSAQQGSLHLEAQIKKLLNEQGEFTPSHLQSDLVASFHRFPSDVLEIIAPSKNKIVSSFLSPYFDLSLKASLHNATGPISASLASPNVRFSLDGELSSGVLALHQNISMQVTLNPETSRVLSKKGGSLPIASLSSEHPLSVEVAAQGFSMPLFPLAVDRIEIPQAQITPGKVFCENKGNLNLMLEILKSKRANQSKHLELWFAPLNLSIHKGILDLERSEVLVASTYDVALWGRINFPGNRVNMILGLTAQCLNAAFSIQGLPKDYVLQIPITGTLDNIALNKNAATSKIVALTLWQNKNIAGNTVGGIGGALVGGVLNQVLAPPGNDKPTPPAKTPFPWQQQ